jgi:hypothetical protein
MSSKGGHSDHHDDDGDSGEITTQPPLTASVSLSPKQTTATPDDKQGSAFTMKVAVRKRKRGKAKDVHASDKSKVFTKNKKKRSSVVDTALSSSSSSSSSDDDDDDEPKDAEGDSVTSSVATRRASNVTQPPPSATKQPSSKPVSDAPLPPQQPDGWRVKLYRLNADGSWDDCGTGRILCLYKPHTINNWGGSNDNNDSSDQSSGDGDDDACVYRELGEPTLCMHSEVAAAVHTNNNHTSRILLRTRILLRETYQRQGENIITWCEPYLEEGTQQGVDLALSFQDNAGCLDIWKQITQVQARANELLLRASGKGDSNSKHRTSVTEMAEAVAAARNADLHQQDQREIWVNVASEATAKQNQQQQQQQRNSSMPSQHRPGNSANNGNSNRDQFFEDSAPASYHDNSSPGNTVMSASNAPKLPNPPSLSNLEEIADTIAAVQVRDTLFY